MTRVDSRSRAGLNLALTDPADMRGLVLLGEIFVEYSRFSKKVVLQTTSALLGAHPHTSDVHVTELNVTIAPMFRYDGWKVVRPFFIPVGVAFLVNSPPSNDTTYLDIGLHFAGGFDFVLMDEISCGRRFSLHLCVRPVQHKQRLPVDRSLRRRQLLKP